MGIGLLVGRLTDGLLTTTVYIVYERSREKSIIIKTEAFGEIIDHELGFPSFGGVCQIKSDPSPKN